MQVITLKEALENEEIDYSKFYTTILSLGIGCWDSINSTVLIKSYIKDMIDKGIHVSHMLQAIECLECETDDWKICLDNSMLTPEPINNKQELVKALELDEDDLKRKITIRLD